MSTVRCTLHIDGRLFTEYAVDCQIPEHLRNELKQRVADLLNNQTVKRAFERDLQEGQDICWRLAVTQPGKITLRAGATLQAKRISLGKDLPEVGGLLETLSKVHKGGLAERVGKNAPTSEMRAVSAKMSRIYRETLSAVHQEIHPSDFYAQTVEPVMFDAGGAVVNGCSIMRNSLALAGKGMTVASGVTGVVPGITLVLLGGIAALGSWKAGRKTERVDKDLEGGWLGISEFIQNIYMSVVGLLLALAYIPAALEHLGAHIVDKASSALWWAGPAVTILGVLFYGLLAVIAGYRLAIAGSFRATMNHLLYQNGQEKELKQPGLVDTVRWLQSEVTLSNVEQSIIAASGKGDVGIQEALRRKWSQFARRTNHSAREAVSQAIASNLLERLQKDDSVAIAEAKILIHTVSRANFDNTVKNLLKVLIGIVGIVAFLIAPWSGALIFTILAVVWLMAGDVSIVHTKTCDVLWFLRNQIYAESAIDVEAAERRIALEKERASPGVASNPLPSVQPGPCLTPLPPPSPTSSTGLGPSEDFPNTQFKLTDAM